MEILKSLVWFVPPNLYRPQFPNRIEMTGLLDIIGQHAETEKAAL
jgi:hypothetical protein